MRFFWNQVIFQPDETLIRCGYGCEATFNWQRPPSCNLCEETGFTVEYDIEESFSLAFETFYKRVRIKLHSFIKIILND